jgi:tetratricopeptide (TPR) repeat protein
MYRKVNPGSTDDAQNLPDAVLDLLRQAEHRLRHGEFSLASQALEKGLAFAPDHPELVRRQAIALHMQDRFGEAAGMWQRVLRQCPGDATVYNNLGSALGAAGDMQGAVAALRRACELAPERDNYWYNLAKALEGIADAEGAHVALTRLLELRPDDAEARILRADSLKVLGRLGEAEADLRYVLARHPDSIEAWTPLVNLKAVRLSEQDLAAIRRVYSRRDIDENNRISLGFAYGLALEAGHRYAEAFPVFAETNKAKREHIQWDPEGTTRLVDDTMKAFERSLPQAPDPAQGREVIFLFGMPRSGSTLLEQILCAHPQVEGAGEIGDFGAVLLEESRRRGVDVPQWAPLATAADWERLGKRYLERTAHWRRSRPIFTDKELGKWHNIGVARAMLPGARFIHCRRDVLETCWSCFKHEFKKDQLYSYDFDELATYWHDYERMVQFWHTRFPGLIHDHVYEELVERPEPQIRQLLAYCGLPFDPACMRFHEVERNVRTASAGQVRQPLDRNTAVSGRYGSLLDPLRRALGLHVPRG